MRIISIESPQQLKDGTVKASIVVAEENYIPLILLKVRAQKGDAIEIDDASGENLPAYNVLINIQSELKIISEEIEKLYFKGTFNKSEEIEKEDV